MKISIIFITSDEKIGRFVGITKQAIVPASVRDRFAKVNFSATSLTVTTPGTSAEDIFRYLRASADGVDGVIIFCEDRLADLLRSYQTAFCVHVYERRHETSISNYLGGMIAKVLRAFDYYSRQFSNFATQKFLILPLGNFDADENTRLKQLFSPIQLHDFHGSLEALLRDFRKRQRPKREGSYRDVYVVDNRNHFYRYGHERHARAETKSPPHNGLCKIKNEFRFGLRVVSDRHFNVSKEGEQISGDFVDCHESQVIIRPSPRINMFVNDYCS